MRYVYGRYGAYPVKGNMDPSELRKRLLWLKEMEKRYFYIERFAQEEVYGNRYHSCSFWGVGTTPF